MELEREGGSGGLLTPLRRFARLKEMAVGEGELVVNSTFKPPEDSIASLIVSTGRLMRNTRTSFGSLAELGEEVEKVEVRTASREESWVGEH